MRLTPQIVTLMTAATAMGDLRERFVFVGGAVVDILLSDPQAPPARPTKDIDVIVELATMADYYEVAKLMRFGRA